MDPLAYAGDDATDAEIIELILDLLIFDLLIFEKEYVDENR
jgi:hypothetical protein